MVDNRRRILKSILGASLVSTQPWFVNAGYTGQGSGIGFRQLTAIYSWCGTAACVCVHRLIFHEENPGTHSMTGGSSGQLSWRWTLCKVEPTVYDHEQKALNTLQHPCRKSTNRLFCCIRNSKPPVWHFSLEVWTRCHWPTSTKANNLFTQVQVWGTYTGHMYGPLPFYLIPHGWDHGMNALGRTQTLGLEKVIRPWFEPKNCWLQTKHIETPANHFLQSLAGFGLTGRTNIRASWTIISYP